MSHNAHGAVNQQATLAYAGGASETTRQAPSRKEEIKAYLNGAIHDASLNKIKRVRFAQKNRQWLEFLQDLLKEIGYNSWIYKEGKTREVYVLETLCDCLDFKYDPSGKSRKEKIEYIKGFFDAEGGIPHQKGRFYIQLVQKNLPKIQLLKKMLSDLGIDCGKIHNPSKRADPEYWRIFILSKDHKHFARIINSNHPIKKQIFLERMMI